jgi:hypothetical protein
MSTFGDFDLDDAYDTAAYDAEAVGRHYVDKLHGFDKAPLHFDDLLPWQRQGVVAGVVATLTLKIANPTVGDHALVIAFWLVYAGYDPDPVPVAHQFDDIPDRDLRQWIEAVVVDFVLWVQRQGALHT